MLTRRAALAAVGSLCAGLLPPVPAAADGAAIRRSARLARGLNASLWLDWVPGGQAGIDKINAKFQASDFAQMRDLGFTHVRVPVQPEWLAPGLLQGRIDFDPRRLALADQALGRVLDAGLGLVIDAHPTEPLKDAMAADAPPRDAFARWWQAMARHVATTPGYDPERTFLELFNEPNGRYWNQQPLYRALIEGVVAAIRTVAPQHTLIVGGTDQNAPEALFMKLRTPLADPGCIYSFHSYNPMEFTHQGATWAGQGLGEIGGLRWNVGPQPALADQARTASPKAAERLRAYAQRDHHRDALLWPFAEVGKWCQQFGVNAWMGEFGVFRKAVDPQDRAAWIRDVRTLAETQGIGWCLWEAVGDFGFFLPGDERPLRPDPLLAAALGLPKG